MDVIFNAIIHNYPKMHVIIDGLIPFTMLEPQHPVSLSVYRINVTDVSSIYFLLVPYVRRYYVSNTIFTLFVQNYS
jgi:hypothetical protein